jgi:predicted DNA-binding transcriptional regulator YafY
MGTAPFAQRVNETGVASAAHIKNVIGSRRAVVVMAKEATDSIGQFLPYLKTTLKRMSRPTTRLLAVLELLQAQERITGLQLASALNVDRRSIRRYIVMLEEMGIPLSAERGRDGAYFLVSGFKLPPMMFTQNETLALAIGLAAARGLNLASMTPAIVSVQKKLERVMPAALKSQVEAVVETVALGLSSARHSTPVDPSTVATLSGAARRQMRVSMTYAAATGASTRREIDPYGLGYRGGHWYLVGKCHLRNGVRVFRLDRVAEVHRLDAHFERPRDFDALEVIAASIANLPRAHSIEVLLKTTIDRARLELFAAAGVLETVSGGVLLRSQADDLSWFARELSRLPFAFEIRKPAALVKALAIHGRRLVRSAAKHG